MAAIIAHTAETIMKICLKDSVLYSMGIYLSAAPIMFIIAQLSDIGKDTVPWVIASIVISRLTRFLVKLNRLHLVVRANGMSRRKKPTPHEIYEISW